MKNNLIYRLCEDSNIIKNLEKQSKIINKIDNKMCEIVIHINKAIVNFIINTSKDKYNNFNLEYEKDAKFILENIYNFNYSDREFINIVLKSSDTDKNNEFLSSTIDFIETCEFKDNIFYFHKYMNRMGLYNPRLQCNDNKNILILTLDPLPILKGF